MDPILACTPTKLEGSWITFDWNLPLCFIWFVKTVYCCLCYTSSHWKLSFTGWRWTLLYAESLYILAFSSMSWLGGSRLKLSDLDAGEAQHSYLSADTDILKPQWAIHPGSNPLQRGWIYRLFSGIPTGLKAFLEPPGVCGFRPGVLALCRTRLFCGTYDKYQKEVFQGPRTMEITTPIDTKRILNFWYETW